jgi:hypothetical protein
MSPSTDIRENREFASELKFVVNRALAEQIRDWARTRLSPDPNASDESIDAYHITSLYFDTSQFDAFHRRGSFGRSKYRIRRYGMSEAAFLERKLKTRGLLSKRRSVVKLDELNRLGGIKPERGWAGFWYHQRLLARRLLPVCRISYRRTARVAMTGYGPIRLTLDDDIRALGANRLVFDGDAEGRQLSETQIIIELKYRCEMPVLFKLLVEEFALNPQPISKYRLAAVALGLVTEPGSNATANPPSETPLCMTF